jgi:hypothetical protein
MRSVVFALVTFAASAYPTAAPAAVIESPSTIVSSQVGSWDCTISSPGAKEDEQLVIVWAPYGKDWIRGSVDVPVFGSRPAHKADFSFGYDVRQKLWVSVYTDSLGSYAVAKSNAPPTSRKMTFTDAYPIDPENGPSVVNFGAQTSTIDSSWTAGGKKYTSHEACSKIPG